MRMFKSRLRTGGVLINVLIAVAVSLIVNFSYFVFMILHRTARMPSEHPVSENSTLFMVLEVLFYMAVSFILLTVFTHNLSESKIRSRSFPKAAAGRSRHLGRRLFSGSLYEPCG